MKRLILALIFILWMGLVLSLFYGFQKTSLITIWKGIADSIWAILIWLLLFINGLGIGDFLLKNGFKINLQPVEQLLIGGGFGLGILGFVGFFLGTLGWTSLVIIISSQLGIFILLHQSFLSVINNLRETIKYIHNGLRTAPLFLIIALGCTLLFTILLALAPPADAFDALFYHLVEPSRIINNGGIQPSNVPHSWFPALPEGLFLLAQGMKSVRTTQLLHFTWAVLSILLIWHWAQSTWNKEVAQATLVIILSMPSFYLLASWAYTDFTLVFFVLAALFSINKSHENESQKHQIHWIILTGIFSGMAMGVKYTSFIMPITILLLVFLWNRRNLWLAIKLGGIFSIIAFVVASPWYIRNWLVMENPFYPFVFGGHYWDEFRNQAYAQPGTGIGWNLKELFLLPLNATLGHRDANYYDGRIGPLYLILAPLTFYYLFAGKGRSKNQQYVLNTILMFSLLSFGVWVLGIVNSSALWQTRLLFPALIPFSLPSALGLLEAKRLDSPKLNVSFILNVFVIVVISITLIDAAIFVIQRNPLAHVVGIESKEAYLHKTQPSYAQAVEIINQIAEDAKVYMLFEPRSYYMNQDIQPDPILDNFAHDFYLQGEPDKILLSWQSKGYTHVLLNRRGLEYLTDKYPQSLSLRHQSVLDDIIQNHLEFITSTEDGSYELYKISSGQ